ncbi:hypothetical protein D3C73_1524230 [compost metagenome]
MLRPVVTRLVSPLAWAASNTARRSGSGDSSRRAKPMASCTRTQPWLRWRTDRLKAPRAGVSCRKMA